MTKRSESREWAVQLLFQREINREDLKDSLELFWQDKNAPQKARDFTEQLVRGVEEHRKEIDELLHKCATNWDVGRMGGVDRNAMRVAVYEMLHRDDIPPVVSINEAVDLAKTYSSIESGKFVNGILDRIRKGIDRPARNPSPAPRPAPPEAPAPPNPNP